MGSFLRSYVVPEGFPGSVNESYVPYMTWRALKVMLLLIFIFFNGSLEFSVID